MGYPATVVDNQQLALAVVDADGDRGLGGLGMPLDVGDCLSDGGQKVLTDDIGNGRIDRTFECRRDAETDDRLQLLQEGEDVISNPWLSPSEPSSKMLVRTWRMVSSTSEIVFCKRSEIPEAEAFPAKLCRESPMAKSLWMTVSCRSRARRSRSS